MKHKIVVSVFTGATVLFFLSCKNKKNIVEKPDTYIATKAIASVTDIQQEYVADIQSLQNVEIRSRAKGFIERILVDEGSYVTKGQILFTLSSKEYQDEILRANAALKNAEAQLKQVEVEKKNTKLLTDKNIVSKSELDMLQAKKDAELASIQESKASISLAQTYLSYTSIRAPFSGYINRLPKKQGSLLEEGDLLTTISNNKEILAYFNVTEVDYLHYIKNLEQYKTVRLKLADGSQYTQTGIIETIDGEINPETGTIAFRAKFSNPDNILKHGASGKIVLSKPLNDVLLIPVKSTYEVQENLYVFVVDKNGTVQQRKVEPIARITDQYAIKSGLTADDKILYEGVQLVKEGDKVQVTVKTMDELLNTKKP